MVGDSSWDHEGEEPICGRVSRCLPSGPGDPPRSLVKRFWLIAFLAATFMVSQLLFHEVLASLGMGSLVPSSALAVLVASGIWLVAYPTMWLRVLTVVAEMEVMK